MKYCKIAQFVCCTRLWFPRRGVGVITSFSSFHHFLPTSPQGVDRVPVRHLNQIECVFKSVSCARKNQKIGIVLAADLSVRNNVNEIALTG